MKRQFFALFLAIAASFPSLALADQPGITVEQPWSRASIGDSRPGAAYLVVQNTGTEIRVLTGVETDMAMMPQIHRTTTDANGVSQMAPAGEIEILAGESLTLAPGGLHIMLMRLNQPLVEGESYALTLVFKNGHNVDISVPILGVAARGPEN